MAACARRPGVAVSRSSHSPIQASSHARLASSRPRIHLPALQRAMRLPTSWRHYTLPSRSIRHYHSSSNNDAAPESQSAAPSSSHATGELRMQRLNEALAALDSYQRALVESAHPQLMALGAAGTARIASLIRAGEPSSHIIVLSMSDGQSKDMRSLVDVIAPLSANEAEFLSISAFTSHVCREYASELSGLLEGVRYCTRTEMEDFARAHFHLLGFDRYSASASRGPFLSSFLSLVRTLEENNWSTEKWDAAIAEKRNAAKLSTEAADDLAAQAEIAKAYSRFVGLKQRFNVYDVNQQASLLLNALEKRPRVVQELRNRYVHLMMDDVQGMTCSQLRLVKRVWGEGSVFFAMDEDQGLAGAFTNAANVTALFPKLHIAALRRSHRCVSQLLSAANTLVSANSGRIAMRFNLSTVTNRTFANDNSMKEKSGEIEADHENAVTHMRFTTQFEEENGIASKMEELRAEDSDLTWAHFAILTRTRADGLHIQKRLAQRGIPSRFLGEQRAADSPEIAFLVSFLSAIVQPTEDRALFSVLQSPVYSVSPADLTLLTATHVKTRKSLRAVLEDAAGGKLAEVQPSAVGVAAIAALLADVARYEKMFLTVKTSSLVQMYLKEKNLLDAFLNPNTVAIDSQGRHIAHLLSRLEQAEPVLRADRRNGLILLLSRLSISDHASEAEHAVQLMTVHKAKSANAQAQVVFLAGAVEGKFPTAWTRPELHFKLPFGSTQPLREQFLAEERNLVYVAMTRARQRFFFTSASSYPLSGSHLWPSTSVPSRFIAEALGFEYSNLRTTISTPFPFTLSNTKSAMDAKAPPPQAAGSVLLAEGTSSARQDTGGGAFALTATDAAMQRPGGSVGPLDFERFLTHSVCPLRYCFRYVHHIPGTGLQGDVLLDTLLEKSADDLLVAARAAQDASPDPPGSVREYMIPGTKDLVAVDAIETAFVKRLQEASQPLGQTALSEKQIVQGLDTVRKFAMREAPFLMGSIKSILSGENMSFELPLGGGNGRTVLVQQPWRSAVEGPEGLVAYTTERLSRRSATLTHMGTLLSVGLRRAKIEAGMNIEWRCIADGKIQKSKISAKAALAAEAALAQTAEQIASGRFEARPSRRNCGSCLYKDTCPSAFRAKVH